MGALGPRIAVIYYNDDGDNSESGRSDGENLESGDSQGSDEEDSDEEQGPLSTTIFAQRCKLTDQEEYYLYDNYPEVNSFVGLAFVTRLTMTHTTMYTMKLPEKMVASLHIPADGVLGVRHGIGAAILVSYKTAQDGCIVFDKKGWKSFLDQAPTLQIGQAIIITGKTTTRRDLEKMLIIDIIRDEPAPASSTLESD